jgi:hypothetical protein
MLFLFLLPSMVHAQRLEKFSDNKSEFISQLQSFMTASKRKVMEETYKAFEEIFKGGMFTDDEIQQILKTGNSMLDQRMTASPYFSAYLTALTTVKKATNGDQRFKDFHALLDGMLSDIENRKLKPFQDFLEFSVHFFEENAIRYSKSGTSWFALADGFDMIYEDRKPVIAYEKLDLMAAGRTDSIFIHETSGRFYPVTNMWEGKGGKVTWERFGLQDEVYVELSDYKFEVLKSLYEVDNVKMHYPLYFGNTAIEGSFSDKLVVANQATEGSYPRFESKAGVLKIDNIGKGIKYEGGFRLHGTTVYGFGLKDQRALIEIFDERDDKVFTGDAELFIIRKGERIVGERVESTLYFKEDSLYHPSVNFRFEIPSKEMQLSRGKRGSDRNPFFSSLHMMNIDAEKIHAYVESDSVIIGKKSVTAAKRDVYFESLKYFRKSDYRRIQNIATSNPIAIMKVTAEREGTNFIDANLLAQRINSKFTVDNITSLLYDLVAQGFINYDSENQLVEVKDKVYHYADADQGKVDYDVLKIKSETDNTNAILNLEDNSIEANGVSKIEFSAKQKVALKPKSSKIVLQQNRNMDFDGRLFSGFSILEGKDLHFDYEKFQIDLDSVRFFDLYVPVKPNDPALKTEAYSIDSRIEHLSGVLLIDAPSNKSGKEDIRMFPSLQSKDFSYVFYDYEKTQGGAYTRDSFYFKLNPFSFNHMDDFEEEDLKFNGTMFSSDIFPTFEETLTLQDHDKSLGFVTNSPEEGFPNYTGKGTYKGEIHLSNEGFLGKGNVQYLGASIDSEDIIFKPKQMLASAETFDLEEDRSTAIEVPQVRGENVKIDWVPYKDSMYVRSDEAPFALYKEDNHTLQGTLILTPGGLKGNGLLDWDQASMYSKLFSFGAFSVNADTTDIRIRAFDTDELALQTTNVKGYVDFEAEEGNFKANDEFLETTLPYNQYKTSMNEFDWDMKNDLITFKADESKLGKFVSIHPDQDSLKFEGKRALYDLRTNELKIGGVPHIVSADAFIYADSGYVEIQPGGVMMTLENAQIVCDTLNQNHVINKCQVDVLGRKYYKADGYYEYNIGDKEQEIKFDNIVGQRVGKGAMSKKRVVTRATGEVTPEDNFYIDHKTEFRGTISLNAESKNLKFDGFARLDADKLPQKQWFTVSSEGDKDDLVIHFEQPKNYDGAPLETGLFLSKEYARIYPRVMMPLQFRKDRPIFPVNGVFNYDEGTDQFIFGDSSVVIRDEMRGNKFTFRNADGSVEAQGKFNLGSGLKYVSIDAAGIASTVFPPPGQEEEEKDEDIMLPDEDIMLPDDTDSTQIDAPMPQETLEQPVTADLMAGIKLILPERLFKLIITDFKSSSFDASAINILTDINFYKKAASELFPDKKEVNEIISAMSTGYLDMPKKYNDYSFLFSKLPMKWDKDYQSFVSTNSKVGLVSIAGESINKMVTCYVEVKMPSNEDDRLYIYLKSPSELFYFFGFKQGILSVTSNNPKFTEEVMALKSKEAVIKMDDGETYEIQAVEPGSANLFLRRIKAAMK